tara:strand:- start:636 stop:1250 length:615 start_codon:yes stop_codon:yes gene_type:complete
MDERDQANWDNRRDIRSSEEAQEDIKVFTNAESCACEIFADFLRRKGHEISVVDNGADNSGEWIENADDVNTDADYVFHIDGEQDPLDMKVHSENFPFMSFKRHQVASYIRQEASLILFRENIYVKFPTEALAYMANHYKAFPFAKWGGKMTYRFYDKSKWDMPEEAGLLNDLIENAGVEIHEWDEPAKRAINEYFETLFPRQV